MPKKSVKITVSKSNVNDWISSGLWAMRLIENDEEVAHIEYKQGKYIVTLEKKNEK